jgi:hypothetical protein
MQGRVDPGLDPKHCRSKLYHLLRSFSQFGKFYLFRTALFLSPITCLVSSVADPHSFFADPDLGENLNAYPYP